MSVSKAREDWLLAEQVALAAANLLAQQLSKNIPATPDQEADLARLRSDAATKLLIMMAAAKAASERRPG